MQNLLEQHRDKSRAQRRQFERLQAILDRLPAPGGLDAMERLPSLAALLPPSGQPIVDWKAMPAACDPCRGGSLGAADTDPCEDAEGDTVGGGSGDACDEEDVCDRGADSAASTVRSEHDPDRHLPLRGRKKRWQVAADAWLHTLHVLLSSLTSDERCMTLLGFHELMSCSRTHRDADCRASLPGANLRAMITFATQWTECSPNKGINIDAVL